MSQIVVRKPAKLAPPRLERPSLLVDRYGNPLATIERVKGQPRSKRKVVTRPATVLCRQTPIIRVVRDYSHLSLGTDAQLRSGGRGRGSAHGIRSATLFGTRTISDPTPGPGLAWFSDFSFTTGTGDSAIMDGVGGTAKWSTTTGGGGPLLTVISAAGLGMPSDMVNVLRAELPANTLSRMVKTNTGHWATPAVSSKIWYRVYSRVTFPNGYYTGGNGNHPWETNGQAIAGNGRMFEWKFTAVSGGLVNLRILMESTTGQRNYDITNTGAAQISTGATYRWEWEFTRDTSTTCRIKVRIYNSSNTLIATEADFTNTSGGATLAADNPQLDTTVGDSTAAANTDSQFQDIMMGNNGPDNDAPSRDHSEYMYWAGTAVSLSDWPGPYSATRG